VILKNEVILKNACDLVNFGGTFAASREGMGYQTITEEEILMRVSMGIFRISQQFFRSK
jgi:hypothetical protein